jgi:hypothetical protein
MKERWVPVPGYEDLYEVGSLGGVRRRGGAVPFTSKRGTNGYLYIDLSRGGKKTRFLVHRLVATAFLGLCPSAAHQVNHRDADRANNAPANLEWVTGRENVQHAILLGHVGGRPMPGAENPRARLTWESVREIRALRGHVGARRLACRYGVSRSAIQWIHQGKHWKSPDEWPADLRVREVPV